MRIVGYLGLSHGSVECHERRGGKRDQYRRSTPWSSESSTQSICILCKSYRLQTIPSDKRIGICLCIGRERRKCIWRYHCHCPYLRCQRSHAWCLISFVKRTWLQ